MVVSQQNADIGGCAPLGGAESPANTMWLGPRPTSVPSDILIHPAVWPEYVGGKVGVVPLSGRARSHLKQCGRGRGLPLYAATLSC